MANEEQLSILKQGVDAWNKWRNENPFATVDLNRASLNRVKLYKANLKGVHFMEADLEEADLSEADLRGAFLLRASLRKACLHQAILTNTFLEDVNLTEADLSKADLRGARLNGGNLRAADLREAILTHAHLTNLILTGAKVGGAIITGSSVFGTSAWDLNGEFKEQKGLIITQEKDSGVTVDNIEVAQFIYLILNNTKIRGVLDTLTSKAVLILGRFAIPDRKATLEALKNRLRDYDLLPIVFDFERPSDKDFTETIKTLAGMCYFVIADVTNPKSSPLELQATVPDYQIPFVPIIQEGENPFAMMIDLQKKYNWVLNTVSYDSEETLMKVLKPLIIDPAMKKRQELRIIKAQVPEVISGKDFLEKGKA